LKKDGLTEIESSSSSSALIKCVVLTGVDPGVRTLATSTTQGEREGEGL